MPFMPRFRNIAYRGAKRESSTRSRKQRLARIRRLMNFKRRKPRPDDESKRYIAIDRELRMIEQSLAHTRSRRGKLKRLHNVTVNSIKSIRNSYRASYVVRVKIRKDSNAVRYVTVRFTSRILPNTNAFLRELSNGMRNGFADRPINDHSVLLHGDDYVEDYWVIKRNNVSHHVVSLGNFPLRHSELSFMNISGESPPPITEEYVNACGYELLHREFGSTIFDIELILGKDREEGITPEDMLMVFKKYKTALLVVDNRGVPIVRHVLPDHIIGKPRTPRVYIATGGHWRLANPEFRTRVMNRLRGKGGGVCGASSPHKKSKVKYTIKPVGTFAEALKLSAEFVKATVIVPEPVECKEPDAEAYKKKFDQLTKECQAWTVKHNAKMDEVGRKNMTPKALKAWKDERTAQRKHRKDHCREYKKQSDAYKSAVKRAHTRAVRQTKKDNKLNRLTLYLKDSTDLKKVWMHEIKNKRLYTYVKFKGSRIVSIVLNPRVKIAVDDYSAQREASWKQLNNKGAYAGQGWSAMALSHFKATAKRYGGFVRSFPNAAVTDITGPVSAGGVTWCPGKFDETQKIESVDAYRMYASVMRAGGFYTIDICDELTPIKSITDIISHKKVRRDRIYLVQPDYKSVARHWLCGSLVDYDLLSAWHEGHNTPAGIAEMLEFCVAYIPVSHQPTNDMILRDFVNSTYATLTSDIAKKRVVNHMSGLLVSDYGRRTHKQQFTDSKTEALFYYHTMNATVKHMESIAEYKTSKGDINTVYAIRGYNESFALSTNIYAHRAVVQRATARMLRMVTQIERHPTANLIGVHVDALAYTIPEDVEVLFKVPKRPRFGSLRDYKEGIPAFKKMEITPHVTVHEEAQDNQNGSNLNYHNIKPSEIAETDGWRLNRSTKRKQLREYLIRNMKWDDTFIVTPSPADLLGETSNPIATVDDPHPNPAVEDIFTRNRERDLEAHPRHLNRAFIQGPAGTGKSHYLRACAEELTSRGFRVATASFTHAAAQIVNGRTLHNLFGISVKTGESTTARISKITKEYDVILIDESPYAPIEVWRILQRLPNDFHVYCFGDPKQLDPVNAEFPISHTQAMRSVCGNRRLILTKQWRSDKHYVARVLRYRDRCERNPTAGNINDIPIPVKDGNKLTFAQMSRMTHLFCENAPRSSLNARIATYLACEHKDGVIFPRNERINCRKYAHYEYPDVNILAQRLRDGTIDEPELSVFVREYLARAELHNGVWRVGVNYYTPSNDRENGQGLQKFPRWLRAQVARNYTDLDYENCGYHLMRALLKKYKLPYDALTYYIENRAKCWKRATVLNAKKAFIAVLNGGACCNSPELRAIYDQVTALYPILEDTENYIHYVRWKVTKAQRATGLTEAQTIDHLTYLKKQAHPAKYEEKRNALDYAHAMDSKYYIKSYVAHLNFMKEAQACRALVSAVNEQQGRKVPTVLCFDGALFHNVKPEQINLKELESLVYANTGLHIPINIKPIHDNGDLSAVPVFTGITADEMEGLMLPQLDEYSAVFPGMLCVLFETIHIDGVRLSNNEQITFNKIIKKDDATYFTFTRKDGTTIDIPEEEARKYSRPAYAMTVHKSQGLTIDGGVCVHQFYETRNDIYKATPASRYVSLTRANDPEQVYVL